MRPEVYDLVENVRSLGIELTSAPTPRCLKITTDPDTFWARLVDVQRSLEAVDRSGGVNSDIDAPAPDRDSEKLRKALDAILRLYELQGCNMEEAAHVIRASLELEKVEEKKTKKKGKEYVTLPVFAPNGIKKKGAYKPRISLIPEMPGSVSMDGLRGMAFDVTYVENISGATLAVEEAPRRAPPAPR